jgi:serine/threonine-protein kinase
VWVDRSGREELVTGAPVREYYALRLSPDGTRVALGVGGENADIWVWEFARRTLTRLTSDLASDVFPIWTPDGRDVVFRRVGENAVVKQSVDGGQQERLHRGNGLPLSFTPDGMTLLLISDGEMSLLPIGASGEVTPLWQTKQITENLGQVSMDGRWLAYQTNESGRNEIHVRPFPDVNSGGRWTVSTAGGTKPVWAPNGRELFYLDADDVLTVVPVQTTPTFRPGAPVKMLATSYFSRLVNGRAYDVAPDGRRFLMIKELPGAGDEVDTVRGSSVVVVLNWTEELKRLEPRN